jgi:hypothetical protein
MEQIEKVQIGDIIAMEEKDARFIKDLMDTPRKMKMAAYDLFERAMEMENDAWDSFHKAYPMFEGYGVKVNHKDMYISVIKKF